MTKKGSMIHKYKGINFDIDYEISENKPRRAKMTNSTKKIAVIQNGCAVSKKYRGVAINKITGERLWTHKKATYKDAYDSAVKLAKRKTVYDNCTIDVTM